MGDTGSEPARRDRARRRLFPRDGLRLRLTLLYGACFLLGTGAVLAVTNVLVARDTSVQTRSFHLRGVRIALPASPLTIQTGGSARSSTKRGTGAELKIEQIQIFPNGTERITWSPSSSSAAGRAPQPPQTGRLSAAQLAKLRVGALAMSRCMRAHGLNYPNLVIQRGPDGNGFTAGLSTPRRIDLRSRTFVSANRACSPLLSRFIPAGSHGEPNASKGAPLVQRQVNVIVDRANAALSAQRSRSLRTLLTWSAVALGVMAVLSILLGWLVAGRGLRPMRAMARRARRITEENLHERLATDAREDELGELAAAFDEVLARLERAFDAQARFIANASHELRTPVTLQRALLEVALGAPDADADTLRRACERALASSGEQQRMIEALLTLARSQGGAHADAPVDLADLVREAMMLREQRLDGLTVVTDLRPASLEGDPALLERLVANLIDNAIVHNVAEGGWITVETHREGPHTRLSVSNSGPELSGLVVSEIFEPFRRAGGERTATATGVGLGLSIVRAIADAHWAAVDARPLDGGGLQVEVQF